MDEGPLNHYNRAEKEKDAILREQALRNMARKDHSNEIHSSLVGGANASKREAKFRTNNISVDYKVVIPRNHGDSHT